MPTSGKLYSRPDVEPYYGSVETTLQALRLVQAARRGILPRITRRLNDTERRALIKSGSVVIFDVEESGIKRWTDGRLWSQSRIAGNFLLYRETNERALSRGAHNTHQYVEEGPLSTCSQYPHRSTERNAPESNSTNDSEGKVKENGLLKKTITVSIDGIDLHLVAYFTEQDVRRRVLRTCHTHPDIMALPLKPSDFKLGIFRNPPGVQEGPGGQQIFTDNEERDYPASPTSPTSASSSASSSGHANFASPAFRSNAPAPQSWYSRPQEMYEAPSSPLYGAGNTRRAAQSLPRQSTFSHGRLTQGTTIFSDRNTSTAVVDYTNSDNRHWSDTRSDSAANSTASSSLGRIAYPSGAYPGQEFSPRAQPHPKLNVSGATRYYNPDPNTNRYQRWNSREQEHLQGAPQLQSSPNTPTDVHAAQLSRLGSDHLAYNLGQSSSWQSNNSQYSSHPSSHGYSEGVKPSHDSRGEFPLQGQF